MKITKRQLKRIIREEYSKLKKKGLIREAMQDEIILDYEKVASDEVDYIVGQLTQAGVPVRPGGVEVFEEKPGMVSIAVSDEHMYNAVIEILGEPPTPHDDDEVQEEEWTEEDENRYQQSRPWEHN